MLELKPGDNFAGCRIVCMCGHGGFGTVYLAENACGEHVAVKIVNTPDKEHELRGIRLFMELAPQSPYLLPIFHVGIERGELFCVMAAADAMPGAPMYLADTLGLRLKTRGRIDPGPALSIVRKIASAVGTLHRAGVIHRDIKPDNIVFVGGEPMLSDPGLMRSTEHSISLAGTLGFLPPECFGGKESNSISGDIYALGKVFYCAVTGESPGNFPRLPRDFGASLCRKLLPPMLRACNEKKSRRYHDVAEFLRDLPKSLPKPGPWERAAEKFRVWRLVHNRLWNSLLAALLLTAGASAWHFWRRHRDARSHAEELAAMKQRAADLRSRIAEGGILLKLQLEHALGGKAAAALLDSAESLPERPREALAVCGKVSGGLRTAAKRQADRAKRLPEAMKRSGEVRHLLDSPLGSWLGGDERKALEEWLLKDESANGLRRNHAPIPGELWHTDSSRMFSFAYVPPGEYISPRTGEKSRIGYPLWVANTEMTVRQFSRLCGFIPSNNNDLDMPVTGVVWNDILDACRTATRRQESWLPAGYVIRPPTEEEWEYCAVNGMRGSADAGANCREAGMKKPRRTGTGGANHFGICDLLGNVREPVLASASTRSHAGSYVLRGGSYSTPREKLPSIRSEVAFYQAFMPDSGVRIAIAPGDAALFDREFRSSETYHFVFNGKHYEFIGGINACFNERTVKDICDLLGGRPAVLDRAELVKKIAVHASPAVEYPVFTWTEFRDGKWMWRNGVPVANAPRAPRKDERLFMIGSKFRLETYRSGTGFVCEWSEEEWRRRGEYRRWRGVSGEYARALTDFTVGDRRFVLFRIVGSPGQQYRYAEIIGGYPAELDSPELLRQAAEHLKGFSDKPILLGGIWKSGNFHWLRSGKPIAAPLPREGKLIDNSPSLFVPALSGGHLCAVQLVDRVLAEFPVSAPEPR